MAKVRVCSPEVRALQLGSLPGSTSSEGHLDRALKDITNREAPNNRVLKFDDEFAILATRASLGSLGNDDDDGVVDIGMSRDTTKDEKKRTALRSLEEKFKESYHGVVYDESRSRTWGNINLIILPEVAPILRIDVPGHSTKGDLIAEARKLFFPRGLSTHEEEKEMIFDLANFKAEPFEEFTEDGKTTDDITVQKYIEKHKLTMARLYLTSKPSSLFTLSDVACDDDDDANHNSPTFESEKCHQDRGKAWLMRYANLDVDAFKLEDASSHSVPDDFPCYNSADLACKIKKREKHERETARFEAVRSSRSSRVPAEPAVGAPRVGLAVQHVTRGKLVRYLTSSDIMLLVNDWICSLAKESENFKLCSSPDVVATPCDPVSNCTLCIQVTDESILSLEDSDVTFKGMAVSRDPSILEKNVVVGIEGAEASGEGVLREVNSLFWHNSLSQSSGDSEHSIPILPNLNQEDYVSIGRILTHQFVLCAVQHVTRGKLVRYLTSSDIMLLVNDWICSLAKESENFKLCSSPDVVATPCDPVSNCTLCIQVTDESILSLEDSDVTFKGMAENRKFVPWYSTATGKYTSRFPSVSKGVPGMSHAGLSHAGLSHAGMSHAGMSHAGMSHAGMSHAGMSHAGMSHAGMSHAGMSHAGMSHAGMSHAGMSHAGMSHAGMSHAGMSHVPGVSHAGMSMSQACPMQHTLFGRATDECKIESFLRLLPPKERECLSRALKGEGPFPQENYSPTRRLMRTLGTYCRGSGTVHRNR
ncbi:Spermidine/spermine N(1)-acetyltransferase-like protein 1 [Stylophora pistillata]|uniref:Spermidine/spermine N(1)-acetyltransferase-like protein 1 n=1 Tax=Stylophora pistillata TaxID=50429 RepID=A0A2B4RKA7_STYPI|nr:Spermidine/spermine N(1)-acetyltransferase-like protein 1 [Stylophora pistillata]